MIRHAFVEDPHHANQCGAHVNVSEGPEDVLACCGYPREKHPPLRLGKDIVVTCGTHRILLHVDDETWAEHALVRIENLMGEYERQGVALKSRGTR